MRNIRHLNGLKLEDIKFESYSENDKLKITHMPTGATITTTLDNRNNGIEQLANMVKELKRPR